MGEITGKRSTPRKLIRDGASGGRIRRHIHIEAVGGEGTERPSWAGATREAGR